MRHQTWSPWPAFLAAAGQRCETEELWVTRRGITRESRGDRIRLSEILNFVVHMRCLALDRLCLIPLFPGHCSGKPSSNSNENPLCYPFRVRMHALEWLC